MLIQAGSLETLVDQIRAFVARASEDGIEQIYSEYPNMVHVWHLHRDVTPDGTRAIDEAGAFIRRHTGAAD